MNDTPIYHLQGDLFATYVPDLPLRNQHEIMERPFFSLSKNQRTEPIQYTSPDNKVYVRVSPGSDHPMATMYDQDILIGVISILIHRRNKKANDVGRTLHFYPQDLLRMIGRPTGGKDYQALREGLARLKATTITTNIRARAKQKHAMFNWIDAWTDETDRDARISHGMSVTLSDWLYEGAMMPGGVLKLSPDYFKLKGGYERWLYMIARKHASQPQGWKFTFTTLYEKSGSEAKFAGFKHALMKIINANKLLDYNLHIVDTAAKDPVLHITPRTPAIHQPDLAGPNTDPQDASPADAAASDELSGIIPKPILAAIRKEIPAYLPSFLKLKYDEWHRQKGTLPLTYDSDFLDFARHYAAERSAPASQAIPSHATIKSPEPDLSDAAREKFRTLYPRHDLQYVERCFKDWIKGKTQPGNYEAAFFGFAKTHAAKNPI